MGDNKGNEELGGERNLNGICPQIQALLSCLNARVLTMLLCNSSGGV